jgi:hypothetical protein
MRRYPAPHSGQMISDFHINRICDVDGQHSSTELHYNQTDPPIPSNELPQPNANPAPQLPLRVF